MKRLFSATAIALALSAGAALAADLPAVKAPLLPPPPPPPIWTGFYLGLNAGYSWAASNNVEVGSAAVYDRWTEFPAVFFGGPQALALSGTTSLKNRSGFLGGGQTGYNYQFNNNFLVGLEADIQGASIRGEGNFIGGAAWTSGGVNHAAIGGTTVAAHTDWLGTLRGRLGYLWKPTTLFYITGGLAYGGAKVTTYQTALATHSFGALTWPSASIGGLGRYDNIRVGWTIGAGFEWLLTPNLSFKAEYLYYDLGTARFLNDPLVSVATTAVTTPGGTFTGIHQSATRVKFDGHIARLGLNYHFIAAQPVPVVARY